MVDIVFNEKTSKYVLEHSVGLQKFTLMLKDGINPYIDVKDTKKVLLHYAEEVGELMKAYRKGDKLQLANELGDNIILLSFVAISLNLDLDVCAFAKICDNIKKGKFKPRTTG